jgi:hypothetical protein
VGQFMGEHPHPKMATGLMLTIRHHDMLPDRIGDCIHRARRLCGTATAMDPYIAQISSEARFEEVAHGRAEGLTGLAEHLMHNGGGMAGIGLFGPHRPGLRLRLRTGGAWCGLSSQSSQARLIAEMMARQAWVPRAGADLYRQTGPDFATPLHRRRCWGLATGLLVVTAQRMKHGGPSRSEAARTLDRPQNILEERSDAVNEFAAQPTSVTDGSASRA